MAKVSEIEALRRGLIIEDEPGVYARLNPENKTIEYSSGEVTYIGDNPKYFPKDEKQKKSAREEEKIQREISRFPGGRDAGEFAYQFGQKGLAGSAGDWVDRITNAGDDYLSKRQAKKRVSSQISEESPYLSAGATAASFVPDLVATRGMSAATAAPALTVASSGSRVLDEPGQVAGEAVMSAGMGKLLDIGGDYLGKMASRRRLGRDVAREAEGVEARNIAGEAETEALNRQQRQAYEGDMQGYKTRQDAAKSEFEQSKAAYENEVQQAKQRYEQAKATNSNETAALKREYEQSKQAYQQEIEGLPKRKAEAQREFSKNTEKYYQKIASNVPKDKTVNTGNLGTSEFIENQINKGPYLNTRHGERAKEIIQTLFGEGERLSGRDLARRFRSLDEIIARSPRSVQEVLDSYKREISRNLSQEIGRQVAYKEAFPTLLKGLNRDIGQAFSGIKIDPALGATKSELVSSIRSEAREYLNSISPGDLVKKMESGELVDDLIQRAFDRNKFVKREAWMKDSSPDFQKMVNNYESVVNKFAGEFEESIARAELQSRPAASKARRSVSQQFRQTYGLAEPIPYPSPPAEPVYPAKPTPPDLPERPLPPAFEEPPMSPNYQDFSPELAPSLPGPEGGLERLADTLERPMGEMFKGKYDLGPVGNLAKLKYLAGPTTAPLVGAYAGLKALTSPTAGGEMVRASFRNMGIEAIESWAQKYPSYRDGILDDPMERRSLVREIEDDQEIPLEIKALVQSQVNRGRPLTSKMD